MCHVNKASHPLESHIWLLVEPGDFVDGYSVVSDRGAREAAERGLAMPLWANVLLKLRNLLVRPFGLKTTGPKSGDAIGMFPVTYDNGREIMLGMPDKHLDFRISVMREDGRIHMATWVHPKNVFGRLYLAAVMPFHILIVRDALRRIGT